MQWCLCQAGLSGVVTAMVREWHCGNGAGDKEFYTNLNSFHTLQGTINQLVVYTPEWVQLSNQRPGSRVGLECKVVQDEKQNVNDWCGYQ